MNSKPIVISRVGSSLTVDVNVMGFATRDLLGRQGSQRTRFLAGVRECGQGASPQLLCVLCMGRRAQNTLELYQHACLFRRRLRVNPRTSVLSTLFYDSKCHRLCSDRPRLSKRIDVSARGSHAQVHDSKRAQETYEEMLSAGVTPDQKTLSHMIMAHSWGNSNAMYT